MTSSPVKAAVVQAGSILFDTPRTLNKLTALTREAAGRGAQLVVFPRSIRRRLPQGTGFWRAHRHAQPGRPRGFSSLLRRRHRGDRG